MSDILLLGLLAGCSYFDLRTKRIPLVLLALSAALGVLLAQLQGRALTAHEIGGVSVGVLLVLIGKATREGIGYGDGLLLMVTGCFLGLYQNIRLLLGGLFLSALWSLFLLVVKKENKKKEIPFAPFLFLSYLGMVILSI